ncbi:hypothetical protein AAFP35_21795 [Gordonia sp. CPCC 206044]|uniref:hypothetical protein n=1 Tax=Gordonia sp. CPCC 206044 TaxID=3140793 RepID=UPI003AF387A5
MSTDDQRPTTSFSFGRFVLFSLGAGVVVLIVAVPIILLLAQWSPIAGLVGAFVAVVTMIAVIGTVSRRMVDTAERDLRAARDAQRLPNLPTNTEPPTDRNTSTDG